MDFDADWRDKHRQDGLMGTAVVMCVMAGLTVVMRLTSRLFLIHNTGPDDYLIIGAMLLIIGYVIDLFVMRQNHIGFPMTMLTPDNMIALVKGTLAIQLMYYIIVFCIKVSILLTYLRFALTHSFRALCWGTIALHAVFFFISFVVTISQCRPLGKMWDLTGAEPGSCINTTAFFYSTSAFNIVTDIWILLLPIPTLRSVNRPRREKAALFLIFGAGTFALVSSIIRLHTIYRYTEAADKFHDSLLVNLWSMLEVSVAVCCASVPALKPVFSRAQRLRSRRAAATTATATGTEQTPRGGSETMLARSRSRILAGRTWRTRLGSKDTETLQQSADSGADLEKVETGDVQRTLEMQMAQAGGTATPRMTVPQRSASQRSVSPRPGSRRADSQRTIPQRTASQRTVPQMTVTSPPREMEPAVVHETRPGPRPVPWGSKQGSWLRGMDSSETEESMLVFTPLSPRTMGDVARNGGAGMSSSGSTLILQR